ncbi:hypothetical protein DVK05_09940 [Halorubrum sp. Atlit-8R]|uniref:hypothetical protein n=1 Tax=Halorubrum sp. Atlit-8R TaxID=2282126 RepID=UPI000EF19F26|nr:hypothetical protein [Halorubrum sp. Atlit-8R]RLM81308.1 hypothetical protein DVK05_09940 [Halorubrum sp. Atlit-8R]
MDDTPEFTDRQREFLDELPATSKEIAEKMGISKRGVRDHRENVEEKGVDLDYDEATHTWSRVDGGSDDDRVEQKEEEQQEETDTVDLDAVDVDPEADPDASDLTDRQRVIAHELQTGATIDDLASRVNERRPIVAEHVRDLKRQGWQIYHDDTADRYALVDDDHTVRSSEHIATRSRKANRWWERTHNRLQRDYGALKDVPDVDDGGDSAGESIVFGLGDLHIGDRIRRPSDGVEVYNTPIAVGKAEYTAREAIDFAEDRDREYDVGWILLKGDLITCEAIYEGQWENLDRFLNGQLDAGADAGLRIVSAFAEYFDKVNIICQTGNHGEIRANGSSRQANADLLLYERLRNIIGVIQEHGNALQNVRMSIGEPGRFYDFTMRSGSIKGHLRHGDDDKPQSETRAGSDQWRGRVLTHKFDVAWMGHHHSYGRFTVNDSDVFVTSSPKPPGDYAEKLAAGGEAAMDAEAVTRKIAVVHGVNDDGVTDVRAIDTRDYTAEYVPTSDELGLPSPDPVPGAVGPDAADAQPE